MNVLKKVYTWLKQNLSQRLVTTMNPIDQNKVNAFLASWNADRPASNPLWIEVTGIFATMGMTVEPSKPITFQGSYGYPLKMFKNTETSEIKIFDARRFI